MRNRHLYLRDISLRGADKMDLLSKLVDDWRKQDTSPRVSILQDSQRTIFFARSQCANDLAALRPVIEKLLWAGNGMRGFADQTDWATHWDAALASWKVENDKS